METPYTNQIMAAIVKNTHVASDTPAVSCLIHTLHAWGNTNNDSIMPIMSTKVSSFGFLKHIVSITKLQ